MNRPLRLAAITSASVLCAGASAPRISLDTVDRGW